jgi:hypothetical protein
LLDVGQQQAGEGVINFVSALLKIGHRVEQNGLKAGVKVLV